MRTATTTAREAVEAGASTLCGSGSGAALRHSAKSCDRSYSASSPLMRLSSSGAHCKGSGHYTGSAPPPAAPASCDQPLGPSSIPPLMKFSAWKISGQAVRSKMKSESLLESELSGVCSKIFIRLDIRHICVVIDWDAPKFSPPIAHRPSPIAHRHRPSPIAHRPSPIACAPAPMVHVHRPTCSTAPHAPSIAQPSNHS